MNHDAFRILSNHHNAAQDAVSDFKEAVRLLVRNDELKIKLMNELENIRSTINDVSVLIYGEYKNEFLHLENKSNNSRAKDIIHDEGEE